MRALPTAFLPFTAPGQHLASWRKLTLGLTLGVLGAAAALVVGCGAEEGDAAASESADLAGVVEDGSLNRCTEDQGCKEVDTYSATSSTPDVARIIGTFILASQDGPHRSELCELTFEGQGVYDEASKAKKVTNRNYRAVRCGGGEERGTYKVFENSSGRQYLELRSSEGKTRYHGLAKAPAASDMWIETWYYASEDKRAKRQPKFDVWAFVRAGRFWCETAANCEGQYLGCFTPRSSNNGGGVNCENGPPWKCEQSKCIGIAGR